jgi:alpha-amylase/alpha-mannosidase (GH57 family)
MNTEMTKEEKEGVEAVQFLLSLTGDKEPEWVSLRNWRSFSESEKGTTMEFYQQLKPKEVESVRQDDREGSGLVTTAGE